MIRVTFLGTAAARPTVRRNVSAIALQREGDSFLLEFNSVTWVQCGYSPPYDVAKYDDEDLEEDDGEDFEEQPQDPELQALLADHGLEGAWNCQDAPPKLW